MTFYSCSSLSAVAIPNSVSSIGNNAFQNCSSLTSITIPNGVTSIGESAFSGCNKLTSINIPNDITSIENRTFYGCSSLTSIIIPNGVTSIGESAFSGCNKLTSINIPNDITSIENRTFYDCSSLASIIIPNGVTSIGESAFYGCKGFIDFSLPSSITSIEESAFSLCTSLKDFYCYAENVPTTAETAFSGVSTSNVVLHVPAGTTTLYMNASPWNTFKSIVAEKGRLIARVANKTREYGEDNPQFDIIYSGFMGVDDESVITVSPTVSTIATKTSDVGNYEITISGGEAQNYDFVYELGTLTITKTPLTATVNDETRQYGSDNPNFTVSYTGLKNDETAPKWSEALNIETTATKQSNVGTYAITATGIPVNYDLSKIESGALTITPAPLTIIANDATRLYHEEEPTFSYSCNGFVNDDDESVLSTSPILSTMTTLSSNVGNYDITVEGASCANYSISYVSGTLAITPRTLVASVENYERQYNEENPEFEVIYEGFVENENEDVLTVKPIASTTATKTSDVGVYPITVSGGSAQNYTFTYNPGELTINKAEQSILWNQDLSRLKIGDQKKLEATATSGMPVAYTITDNSIADIYAVGNDLYLDCRVEGQTSIVAAQEGNSNYYPAIRIQKTLVVTTGTQFISDENIDFIDDNVKAICIANWDANSDGELSYYEATLVKSLGNAFKGNRIITSFEELKYFTGLTSIGESSFDGCSSLVAVVIPENVTSIGEFAFNSCFALSSISIPDGVTNIGAGAFLSCSSLTTVRVDNPTPCPIVSYTFSNRNNATLYVPYGCEPAYQAAEYWRDFYDIVEMPAPMIIDFADDYVKDICVDNWDVNDDGELDDHEAAKVHGLGDAFTGNKDITSFDELIYFTGLTSIQ